MTTNMPIQGMSSVAATRNPIQPVQRGRAAYRTMARDARKPESTEGGRRVSVLKRQEGAPVLLG